MNIGEKIKQSNKGKKINKKEIARKTGIEYQRLIRIINGKVKEPSESELYRLSNHIKIGNDVFKFLFMKTKEEIQEKEREKIRKEKNRNKELSISLGKVFSCDEVKMSREEPHIIGSLNDSLLIYNENEKILSFIENGEYISQKDIGFKDFEGHIIHFDKDGTIWIYTQKEKKLSIFKNKKAPK